MAHTTVKCPKCGSEAQLDESKEKSFCVHCGSPIYPQDIAEQTEDATLMRKNTKDSASSSAAIYLFSFFLVLLAIPVFMSLLASNGNNPKNEPPTQTPTSVSPPSIVANNFFKISLGYYHTLALKNDGSFWVWGSNTYGQLGDGTMTTYDDEWNIIDNNDKSTPKKIMDDVAQISAGDFHTMAIKNDGSLWVWGDNVYGQLGDGTTEYRHTPTKIMDDVAQVSAGAFHTLAIKNNGSLWAWGYNYYGQLGDGTTEDKSTPKKIMDDVAQISAGGGHTMAIKSDGSLWAWGYNWNGQLGDGTITTDDEWNTIENNDKLKPKKIMADVTQVSAGWYHTLAVKNDGSLWAWGANGGGQLGDGTTEDKSTPTKIMDDVSQISVGYSHMLAVKNDGSLWAWGYNWYGQLGDGTTASRNTPVKISD